LELLDRYRLEGLGYSGLWQLLVGYQAAHCDRISRRSVRNLRLAHQQRRRPFLAELEILWVSTVGTSPAYLALPTRIPQCFVASDRISETEPAASAFTINLCKGRWHRRDAYESTRSKMRVTTFRASKYSSTRVRASLHCFS
jgi:hypothetical protein